jgi:hypothetical protein
LARAAAPSLFVGVGNGSEDAEGLSRIKGPVKVSTRRGAFRAEQF